MIARTPLLAVPAIVLASVLMTGCTGPTAAPETSATQTAVSVDDLLQLGIAAAQEGDLDQAAATFRTVLSLDPGNALANYNLGVLAQQGGDNTTALSHYDAALETIPDFTSALFNKAIIVEQTDVAGAVALYEQIIGLDDEAATAYLRLSILLDQQGDADGATAARDRALALDPTLASALPPAAPEPAAPEPEATETPGE